MKKLEFITEYRRIAPQMTGHVIAGNWMRLAEALDTAGVELTAAEAAKWADHGYLPEEAGPLLLSGISADRQAELEQYAADQVGGHEALAALRIAELHASGVLRADDVVEVADPFDPSRSAIVPRDEL